MFSSTGFTVLSGWRGFCMPESVDGEADAAVPAPNGVEAAAVLPSPAADTGLVVIPASLV